MHLQLTSWLAATSRDGSALQTSSVQFGSHVVAAKLCVGFVGGIGAAVGGGRRVDAEWDMFP